MLNIIFFKWIKHKRHTILWFYYKFRFKYFCFLLQLWPTKYLFLLIAFNEDIKHKLVTCCLKWNDLYLQIMYKWCLCTMYRYKFTARIYTHDYWVYWLRKKIKIIKKKFGVMLMFINHITFAYWCLWFIHKLFFFWIDFIEWWFDDCRTNYRMQ